MKFQDSQIEGRQKKNFNSKKHLAKKNKGNSNQISSA